MLLALGLAQAEAQKPAIKTLFPLLLTSGKSTRVEISGEGLSPETVLWTSFAAAISRNTNQPASSDKSAAFDLSIPAGTPAGIGAIRLMSRSGISDLRLVMVDSNSPVTNANSNHSRAMAQNVSLPVGVEGTAELVTSHWFQFRARKGQRISAEVVAARVGSAMDPVLRFLDAEGREIAYNEDVPMLGVDARIDWTAPKAGLYFIELRDTLHQGGANYFYHLRIVETPSDMRPFLGSRIPVDAASAVRQMQTEIEPNNADGSAMRVEIPSWVEGRLAVAGDRDFYELHAEKDETLVIHGRARSIGSPCDLYMQLLDAGGGKVAEANATGADEGSITNKIKAAGTYRILVEELNRRGDERLRYQLWIKRKMPGFELSLEEDQFAASPGASFKVIINVVRHDYTGPIELAWRGEAGGLMLMGAPVPAKTNAAEIRFTVPENTSPAALLLGRMVGRADIDGASVEVAATTAGLWRKRFPLLRPLPLELEGLVSVGVIVDQTSGSDTKKE